MTSSSPDSPITAQVLEKLQQWEGRREYVREPAAPQMARGMAALFNREQDMREGDALPPLWHWTYFTPRAHQRALGNDGHPKLGQFLPPVPLPRRMWAGGRLRWHDQMHVGEALERVSTVVSVKHKGGRTGDLVFVLVAHEILAGERVVLTEEQDIVYRAPAQSGGPKLEPAKAPESPVWSRSVTPDPTLLFRYSALTFNAHRIHYDRTYAVEEEGYEGLVVHGPLLATFLANLASEVMPGKKLAAFNFRAVHPLLDSHPFRVCGAPADDSSRGNFWIEDKDGGLTMQADVEWR